MGDGQGWLLEKSHVSAMAEAMMKALLRQKEHRTEGQKQHMQSTGAWRELAHVRDMFREA